MNKVTLDELVRNRAAMEARERIQTFISSLRSAIASEFGRSGDSALFESWIALQFARRENGQPVEVETMDAILRKLEKEICTAVYPVAEERALNRLANSAFLTETATTS